MPFRSDLTSAVTLRSSSAAPGTNEKGREGGEEGGGKGGEGAEGGGGQQSAEPHPASKQDCRQNGPCCDVPSIHFCFEQALSNNNLTPFTDRQSLHFSPPALPIDLGALSSHITHGEGGGGEGGGGWQQLALRVLFL